MVVLNGMTHVVVSVMVIFVFIRILGDAVPVMISEKSSLKFSFPVTRIEISPHVHLVGVNHIIVFWKRVLGATHHQNPWHEL